MTAVLADTLVVSLAGGALSLDRNAAFQTMVSRPIVSAPVIGYLLGSTGVGLAVGVVLELILMGDLPVGAYVPVHETSLAAAVTAVTVALAGGGAVMTAFPIALLVSVPVAAVYRRADNITRGFNSRFFHAAEASIAAGGGGGAGLMALNLRGVAVVFLSTFATLFVTVLPMLLAASALSWKAGGGAGGGAMFGAFAGCVLLGLGAGVGAVSDGARSFAVFTAALVAAALFMAVLI